MPLPTCGLQIPLHVVTSEKGSLALLKVIVVGYLRQVEGLRGGVEVGERFELAWRCELQVLLKTWRNVLRLMS